MASAIPMQKQNSRHLLLDLLRGTAALEVCANHVRRLLLQPYSDLAHPKLIDTAIYLATSFAHQAVVVFFVLSGFLVGGSVHQAHTAGRWNWTGYSVQRLSRLWAVLVPCLVLTLAWDRLGATLGGGRGYDGALADMMFFGTSGNPPLAHSWGASLGNLFFLQDIVTPMLGSNLALWSLANEFWYYVIFPLGFFALRSSAPTARRIALASVAILICAALPWSVLEGGIVWLMGYGGWLVVRDARFAKWLCHPLPCVALIALLLASLASVKSAGWLASDFVLGACVMLLLPFLIHAGARLAPLRSVATCLSDVSYSLYLSHFPLLAFIIFGVMKTDHLPPDPASYALYLGFMALLVAYAALVWFLFEKRTPSLRTGMNSVVDSLKSRLTKATRVPPGTLLAPQTPKTP